MLQSSMPTRAELAYAFSVVGAFGASFFALVYYMNESVLVALLVTLVILMLATMQMLATQARNAQARRQSTPQPVIITHDSDSSSSSDDSDCDHHPLSYQLLSRPWLMRPRRWWRPRRHYRRRGRRVRPQ
jgi:hypothetical protein